MIPILNKNNNKKEFKMTSTIAETDRRVRVPSVGAHRRRSDLEEETHSLAFVVGDSGDEGRLQIGGNGFDFGGGLTPTAYCYIGSDKLV